MTDERIANAIKEAKRFIERATDLRVKIRSEVGKAYCIGFPKEMGAARRASMDLTRALVEMRRPG